MAKAKKQIKKKTTKIKTTPEIESINIGKVERLENEFGLITEKPELSKEDFIKRIMNFLGYDKKRAMSYNYYIKSHRKTQSTFKERELLKIFEE